MQRETIFPWYLPWLSLQTYLVTHSWGDKPCQYDLHISFWLMVKVYTVKTGGKLISLFMRRI